MDAIKAGSAKPKLSAFRVGLIEFPKMEYDRSKYTK